MFVLAPSFFDHCFFLQSRLLRVQCYPFHCVMANVKANDFQLWDRTTYWLRHIWSVCMCVWVCKFSFHRCWMSIQMKCWQQWSTHLSIKLLLSLHAKYVKTRQKQKDYYFLNNLYEMNWDGNHNTQTHPSQKFTSTNKIQTVFFSIQKYKKRNRIKLFNIFNNMRLMKWTWNECVLCDVRLNFPFPNFTSCQIQ